MCRPCASTLGTRESSGCQGFPGDKQGFFRDFSTAPSQPVRCWVGTVPGPRVCRCATGISGVLFGPPDTRVRVPRPGVCLSLAPFEARKESLKPLCTPSPRRKPEPSALPPVGARGSTRTKPLKFPGNPVVWGRPLLVARLSPAHWCRDPWGGERDIFPTRNPSTVAILMPGASVYLEEARLSGSHLDRPGCMKELVQDVSPERARRTCVPSAVATGSVGQNQHEDVICLSYDRCLQS